MLAHLATILRPYKTQAALMAAGDTRLDTTYNTHAYQHHVLWGASLECQKDKSTSLYRGHGGG